jgi:arsenate reductase-like glutaredoxin family protein
VSCNKAQQFFEQNRTKPDVLSDTRKEKIGKEQAWGIIGDKKNIYIAKGKIVVSFKPDESNKEAILAACMGRSGTLRAPALVVKDEIYVGFNDRIYETIVS